MLEYYFDKIFTEDLELQIQKKITDPSFNYKNKKSVGDLLKTIKKRLKDSTSDTDEFTALTLLLEKFIDYVDLEEYLEELDLIGYYKEHKISFLESGNKKGLLDFTEMNRKNLISSLATRIYQTRCAIVHSKSSKGGYRYVRDQNELRKEIPLIKYISEKVIIENAENI